jgi:sec-independent protein translocase protein TatB
MLDVAWPELIVIGAVALVAIGPKDLPKVMHNLGKWAGKARLMMGDLQRAFDQLSYETEIAEKLKRGEATPPVSEPPKAQDSPSTPTPMAPKEPPTSSSPLMAEPSQTKP